MYADLGPGQMLDLDPPSPNEVDLLYSHEFVANSMHIRTRQLPNVAEKTNLYAYVIHNPVNYVDPNGLYASPGYGHFCGSRNGEVWYGASALDCLDEACKWHDECIGPLGNCIPFTFKITYCDQRLSIKAYYCAAVGCDTAKCRAAAAIIGAWMAMPGAGTIPIGGPVFE